MIPVDAALRLLRNIVDGIRPFDVATWIVENGGTVDFNPELDEQDLTTLMRMAVGEEHEVVQRAAALVPRIVTDKIMPTDKVGVITEGPRVYVGKNDIATTVTWAEPTEPPPPTPPPWEAGRTPHDAFHWDVT